MRTTSCFNLVIVARGAMVGEIAIDDAGADALAGGRHACMNQAARAQPAKAAKTQTLDTYCRAYGACMQGRGYTVK